MRGSWQKTGDTFCRYPLLPISEFVLDEKFQQNAPKFAIFYIGIRKPKIVFCATLIFPLIYVPILRKNKVAQNA